MLPDRTGKTVTVYSTQNAEAKAAIWKVFIELGISKLQGQLCWPFLVLFSSPDSVAFEPTNQLALEQANIRPFMLLLLQRASNAPGYQTGIYHGDFIIKDIGPGADN